MLPINLHNKLAAEAAAKAQAEQAAKTSQSVTVLGMDLAGKNPDNTASVIGHIKDGQAQYMTMVPCVIVHPGVISSGSMPAAVKDILDSIDAAEIAPTHILEGATIVPLIPEINRESRELSFAMTITVSLPHLSDADLAKLSPPHLAQEIVKSMQALSHQGLQGLDMKILFPTLSPTQMDKTDPFEQ